MNNFPFAWKLIANSIAQPILSFFYLLERNQNPRKKSKEISRAAHLIKAVLFAFSVHFLRCVFFPVTLFRIVLSYFYTLQLQCVYWMMMKTYPCLEFAIEFIDCVFSSKYWINRRPWIWNVLSAIQKYLFASNQCWWCWCRW